MKRPSLFWSVAVLGFCQLSGVAARGASVSADEQIAARRWAAAVFEGKPEVASPAPGLEVLKNWDAVQKNVRYGRPFRIGDKTFDRGLFCHAPSKIIVRLPRPGKTFDALVGTDEALQWDVRDWRSGPLWPEITALVKSGDRELCKVKLVRGQATPIHADLAGAKQLTIELLGLREIWSANPTATAEEAKAAQKNAKTAEINEWCEAEWADARVVLDDGRTLPLDDLTMPVEFAAIESPAIPFSFVYDGKPWRSLLSSWKVERTAIPLDANRTEHTLVYTDPASGLAVRCVAVEYRDFPTVEWTLHFKNTGRQETPIIEAIRPLDMRLRRGPDSEFLLHHSLGSSCRADDFRPMETVLPPRVVKSFAPVTGYSSDPDMPYFNVESGSGEGLIVAVGWPGQWSAEFARDAATALQVSAGQELTHFKLHPGEEVRTPLIALQFWRGDWIHAQNVWRRWMMAHGMPHPGGKLPEPILAGESDAMVGYEGKTEANQKEFIERYVKEDQGINWWWMDFGWHPCGKEITPTSTWKGEKPRFPNGLRPVVEYAHAKGLKCVAWFAPEGNMYVHGHDDWLLKAKIFEPLAAGSDSPFLDYGNPEAWKWLVATIDRTITEDRLDCYRHDTGWGPLAALRANDAADRQGITEIRYVEGFLAYYDELQRRHPNLLIDNCCRGGRRLDLETMRRSVPLWRSDWYADPVGSQSQTHGIAIWLPFYGTGVPCPNTYDFRSEMCPSTVLLYDLRDKNLDYAQSRRNHQQWREVAANYYGDYYPLTRYTPEPGQWMAWQFNRPEAGTGFVQVFHRAGPTFDTVSSDTIRLKLQGLDKNATYELRNLDDSVTSRVSGRDLLEKGWSVTNTDKPMAWLFSYKLAK